MRSSVLLGSYVAADTPLHRLDARVKICLLVASTVALFVMRTPVMLVVATVLVVALARLGGVGVPALLKGLKPTAVILAFSLLANAFVVDGSGDLALVGPWGVSVAGLVRGAVAVGRIIVLVAASLGRGTRANPGRSACARRGLCLRDRACPRAEVALRAHAARGCALPQGRRPCLCHA